MRLSHAGRYTIVTEREARITSNPHDFFATLLERQRSWFLDGHTLSMAARQKALRDLGASLDKHRVMLRDALHADLGKSPYDVEAAELGLVQSEIRFALKHLHRWMKPTRARAPRMAWPSRAAIRAEPRGTTLLIGPWNYPLQLLFMPLVSAIAAGNVAIVKPSEFAPASAEAMAAVVKDAFPPELVSLVQGDHTVAAALVALRFDLIFFTGGGAVAKRVLAAAAQHLTPVVLELGGKCPAVVCRDSHLPLAAKRIMWGKTLNAGQTCVAPDYVLADRAIVSPLVAELKAASLRFFGDNPAASPDYGRIVNRRHFDRLVSMLSPGTILHGGQHDAATRYIAPTLITDIPESAPIHQEEIFGPLLPIIPFDDFSTVITTLRRQPSPLAAYLFSTHADHQRQFTERVPAGGMSINDVVVHMLGKHLPFGGVGASGFGRYQGKAGFDTFSNPKSILQSRTFLDLPFRYPPVPTKSLPIDRFAKIMRWLLRE